MDTNISKQDDAEFRAMFNIPEPGTEPDFGLFGNLLVMPAVLLGALALFAGIHELKTYAQTLIG